MPSIPKLRRAWFALLRERGVSPEDRHSVQEAHTGKASLRDWTPADYDHAIAALQRAGRQHADPRAHVREDLPRDGAPPGVDSSPATPAQAGWIEDLCDSIPWRTGRQRAPARYACSSVLKGPGLAARRHALLSAYNGVGPRDLRLAAWLTLTRGEASRLLKGLRKMARLSAERGDGQLPPAVVDSSSDPPSEPLGAAPACPARRRQPR